MADGNALPDVPQLIVQTLAGARIEATGDTRGTDEKPIVILSINALPRGGVDDHYLDVNHARQLALDLLNAIDQAKDL